MRTRVVAEAQHISNDFQQFEDEVQEFMQVDPDQHNDNNTEYSTDVDLPPLVGRQRSDTSSDDSSSDDDRVPYVYHTDHDDSSFESSDDERSSSVLGLQQCNGRRHQ